MQFLQTVEGIALVGESDGVDPVIEKSFERIWAKVLSVEHLPDVLISGLSDDTSTSASIKQLFAQKVGLGECHLFVAGYQSPPLRVVIQEPEWITNILVREPETDLIVLKRVGNTYVSLLMEEDSIHISFGEIESTDSVL